MNDPISSRLEFAIEASERAAELILSYWQRQDLAVELKADSSPVTLADRNAETLLRESILKAFPGDGVLGEEFGETLGTSEYRWILDPVDGTKSFVAGVPLFGTLIGIERAGESVIGVCRFPALGEVVYASEGRGAFWKIGTQPPRAVSVSKTSRLADSLFCFTSVGGWDAIERADVFTALCRRTRLTRGWGDCYGHVLVATGRADLAVDPLMNLWDAAALLPIIWEAGGIYCDWTGRKTAAGGNGISTNPALLEEVLSVIRNPTPGEGRPGRD